MWKKAMKTKNLVGSYEFLSMFYLHLDGQISQIDND